MALSRYITVSDAARRLGLSTQRIYQLIHQDKIDALRVGEGPRRVWLIDGDTLPDVKVKAPTS